MSFAEVQHQPRAVAALEGLLAADRVPHAFIFVGPPGVGKSLAARALARVLLCQKPKRGRAKNAAPQACGACPQCTMVDHETHPDLSVFRRPPERALFPIAYVTRRDSGSPEGPTINESVHLKAMQADRRVTVIEDAEEMTEEAANALLKTFEEAPEGSYIVLLVSSLDRLLPTIRSRGRLVRFGALPVAFVAELLQRDHELSDDDAAALARFSEGSMERAATLARSGFLDLRREVLGVVPGYSRADALALADALMAWASEQARNETQTKAKVEENTLRRHYLKRSLWMLASLFRDALLLSAGADAERLHNADAAPLVRKLAERLPGATLEQAVLRCLEYQTLVDRNVHNQLLMENACLEAADWLAPLRC